MPTMQQMVDYVRASALNDADKVTWTDAELLDHARNGLRLIFNKRPDAFFGLGSYAVPTVEPALGDSFPLSPHFYPAVCKYVAAMAHAKDAEESVMSEVTLFMQLAGQEL